MWRLTQKGAKYRHPHKSKRWTTARYFGTFNLTRRDHSVIGDREAGAHILKFVWTKIVRHTLIKGSALPDDPALADHWTDRRRKGRPPLDRVGLHLLPTQRGGCPLLRGACCCTPTRATNTARMGTVALHRPQSDPQTGHPRRTARRRAGPTRRA